MDKLKKTNIVEESLKCSPLSTDNCGNSGPFFNPDYYAHVVVQTVEELESIPCKLRQDGLVATVVQDDYADYQLQSSRTGFGICDNNAWVKINSGDTFYDGGNLFIFSTQAEADIYKRTPTAEKGQVVYITEVDTYFKYNGQDAYVDPFPNKLTIPTEDGVEGLDYRVPAYLEDGTPYWRSTKDFGKVKTVNNEGPDEDGNIELNFDYIPLAGTEEEKPLSGTIVYEKDANTPMFVKNHSGKFYQEPAMIMSSTDNTFSMLNQAGYSGRQQTINIGHSNTVIDSYHARDIYGSQINVGAGSIILGHYFNENPLGEYQNNFRTGLSLYQDTFSLLIKRYDNTFGHFQYNGGEFTLEEESLPYIATTDSGIVTKKLLNDSQQFVKNGLGWSLKYAVDNPDKYETTGENAINLSKAYSNSVGTLGASGKDSTAIGAYTLARGNNSTAIGWNSKSYGSQSLTIGYSNISYSAFSTVIGGQANIIGTESEITIPVSGLNARSSIFGGGNNKILNGRHATIVGGLTNTITATSKYDTTTNPLAHNIILGGSVNTITDAENSVILSGDRNSISGHPTERSCGISVTGGKNIGKGSYSFVTGYRNTSVTQGETLVGMLSVTQDEALLPNTYYPSSRMFGVGVGFIQNRTTEIRRDGLNVYQNGLVTVPTLTPTLIDAEPTGKVVVTKEYVNIKLDSQEDDVNKSIIQVLSNVISASRPVENNIYILKSLLNNPTITPLEYIDGTYVKKTISNYQITYEPTTLVNATNTISITSDGYLTLSQEGVLFKVWYKNNPARSVYIKSKATTLNSTPLANGETLCFEEVLTGVITEIVAGNLTPPSTLTASFIGKYIVGNKEPKSNIIVKSSQGATIYNGTNNKEDSLYYIDLSSYSLKIGEDYFITSRDEAGNSVGPVTITYN